MCEVKQLSKWCAYMQVVGVGGGGSNAVNRMLANQLTGVEMYVMNTDAQVSICQTYVFKKESG